MINFFARKLLKWARMIKSLIRYLRSPDYRSKVHIGDFLLFSLQRRGQMAQVRIAGEKVWVRKGSPDLEVALSCLTGEFDALAEIFPEDYAGTIVDAGGYIGTSALALRKMFPNARIIVIEASSSNLEVLRKNLQGTEGVEIIHAALVGKDSGEVQVKNRGTGQWGFTVVSEPRDRPEAETLHSVNSVTLESLGVPLSEVGILKLDIEGGEFDLFTHSSDQLDLIDAVFVELHDRIVAGCSELFFRFSKERQLIKGDGEKYLSLRQDLKVQA